MTRTRTRGGSSVIEARAISKVGNRDINEDSIAVLSSNGNCCFVVADGLGGHGKGEVASQTLVKVFRRQFDTGDINHDSFLQTAFQAAQAEILEDQAKRGERFGMKTTAVALTVADGKCRWGHIGDSRLYMFAKNKLYTRTLDHSVPQMLVMTKAIKARDIAHHPDRNRLLRVLGVEWDSPKYDLSEVYASSDCQAFLLCTDGFWEHTDEKAMRSFLKKSCSVDEWLTLMTAAVEENARGRDMDNYSAIAIWL